MSLRCKRYTPHWMTQLTHLKNIQRQNVFSASILRLIDDEFCFAWTELPFRHASGIPHWRIREGSRPVTRLMKSVCVHACENALPQLVDTYRSSLTHVCGHARTNARIFHQTDDWPWASMHFTYVLMRRSRRMAKWKFGSGKTKFINNSSLDILNLSTSSLCFLAFYVVSPNYGYGYFKKYLPRRCRMVVKYDILKRSTMGNTEMHKVMRSCSRSAVSTSLQSHE